MVCKITCGSTRSIRVPCGRIGTHVVLPSSWQTIDQAQAEALLRQSFGVTRFGEPEDIAALATFVVSERGKLLHGSLLDSDGGLTKTI